jgi:hypothetical protein
MTVIFAGAGYSLPPPVNTLFICFI